MEHAASFEQKINTNIVSSLDNLDFSIEDLKRKIDLATGKKKVDLVVKNANIVNVFQERSIRVMLLSLTEYL